MGRAFGIGFVLAVVGCGGEGPPRVEVTGRLTHQGQPLTAGTVWLHTAPGNEHTGLKGSSLLQTDGSFAVRTYPHGDGVPPGEYRLTLSPDLANRIGRPALADPATTTLTLSVPAEGIADRVIDVD